MPSSIILRYLPLNRGFYIVGVPTGPYVAPGWAAAPLGANVFPSKAHYTAEVLSRFDGAGRHRPSRRGLGAVSFERRSAMGEVAVLNHAVRNEPVTLGKRRRTADIAFLDNDRDEHATFKRIADADQRSRSEHMGIYSIDYLISGTKPTRKALNEEKMKAKGSVEDNAEQARAREGRAKVKAKAKADKTKELQFANAIPFAIRQLRDNKRNSRSVTLRDDSGSLHTIADGRARPSFLHTDSVSYDRACSRLYSWRMDVLKATQQLDVHADVDYPPPLTIESVVAMLAAEEETNETYYDAIEYVMDVDNVESQCAVCIPMELEATEVSGEDPDATLVVEEEDVTMVDDEINKQIEAFIAEPVHIIDPVTTELVYDRTIWSDIDLTGLEDIFDVIPPNTFLGADDIEMVPTPVMLAPIPFALVDGNIVLTAPVGSEYAPAPYMRTPSRAYCEFNAIDGNRPTALSMPISTMASEDDTGFDITPLPSLVSYAAQNAVAPVVDAEEDASAPSSPSPTSAPYYDHVLPTVDAEFSTYQTVTDEEVEAFLATIILPSHQDEPAALPDDARVPPVTPDVLDAKALDIAALMIDNAEPDFHQNGDVSATLNDATANSLFVEDYKPLESNLGTELQWDDLFSTYLNGEHTPPTALTATTAVATPIMCPDAFTTLILNMDTFSLASVSTPARQPEHAVPYVLEASPPHPKVDLDVLVGSWCHSKGKQAESAGGAERTKRSSRRLNPLGTEFNKWRDAPVERNDASSSRPSVRRLLKRNKDKENEGKKTGIKLRWNPSGKTAEERLKVVAPPPPAEDDGAEVLVNAMAATGISAAVDMDDLLSAFGSL